MAESHTAKFTVDASGAKKGAEAFTASVRRLHTALKEMERVSDSAFTKLKKTNLGTLAKQLSKLSSVRINPSLGRNLQSLSIAMRSFKAPSQSQVRNVQQLFRILSAGKVSSAAASSISKISAALRTFKAPSGAQTRNLQTFFASLKNVRVPRGFSKIARDLNMVANAATRAAPALNRVQSSIRSTNFRGFSAGARRASGAMRGLENAMSASYQVGSQLRVLFGSLTIGTFTKDVFNASIAQKRFATTIAVTSRSTAESAAIMESTRKIANRFGNDIQVVMEEFGKFSTAARLSGQSLENVNFIYEQFSGAMRVMGLGADRQRLVFLALTQMFSKGRISAEELRRQLGEQIPGAFELMQQAIREATGNAKLNLDSLLKQGKLSSEAVLLLAKKIQEKFGPQFEAASERADAAVGRLKNAWFEFMVAVGEGGVTEAIREIAEELAKMLGREGDFKSLAVSLGKGLGDGIRAVGRATIWTIKHIDSFIAALKAIIAFKLATMFTGMIVGLGQMVTGFIMARRAAAAFAATLKTGAAASAARFLVLLGPIGIGLGIIAAAIALSWGETIKLGDTTTTVGETMKVAWSLGIEAVQDYGAALGKMYDKWDEDNNRVGTKIMDKLAEFAVNFKNLWIATGQTLGNAAVAVGRFTAVELVGLSRAIEKFSAGDSKGAWQSILAIDTIQRDVLISEFKRLKQDIVDTMFGGPTLMDKAFGAGKSIGERIVDGLEDELKRKKANIEKAANELIRFKARDRLIKQLNATKEREAKPTPKARMDKLFTDGNAEALSALGKEAKKAEDATKDHKEQVTALTEALKRGQLGLDQYAAAMMFARKKMEEVNAPYKVFLDNMEKEISLAGLLGKEKRIEAKLRSDIASLAEEGIFLNTKEKANLKNLITEMDKLNNPGPFRSYIEGLDTLADAMENIEVNAIRGMADALTEFVMTGKLDIQSLARSILSQFIKLSLNQAIKGFFDQKPNTSAAKAALATTRADLSGKKTTQQIQSDTAVIVTKEITDDKLKKAANERFWTDNNAADIQRKINPNDPRLLPDPKFQQDIFPRETEVEKAAWRARQLEKEKKKNLEEIASGKAEMDSITLSFKSSTSNFDMAVDKFAAASMTPAEKAAASVQNRKGDFLGKPAIGTPANPAVVRGPSGPVPVDVGGLRGTLGANLGGSGTTGLRGTVGGISANGLGTGSGGATGRTLTLGASDLAMIAKVMQTEVGQRGMSDAEIRAQVDAFSDVVVNRMQSPNFPNTAQGVLNQKNQFSAISGNKKSFGSVANAPPASAKITAMVESHFAARAGGEGSSVGGAVNFANKDFSGPKARKEWVDALHAEAMASGNFVGKGNQTTVFGTAKGGTPAEEFNIALEGTPQRFAEKMNMSMDQVAARIPEKLRPAFDAATDSGATMGESLDMAFAPATQNISQDYITKMTNANSTIAQSVTGASTEAAGPLTGLKSAISATGTAAQGAVGGMGSFIGTFGQFIQQLLGSLGGGGGGFGQIFSMLGPLLGGFAEGTPNTGRFGGPRPAFLHSNEAVIPLTRGRKVPVELDTEKGSARGVGDRGSSAGGSTQVHLNFHGVKDADTFRASESQMKAFAASTAQRAMQRNG